MASPWARRVPRANSSSPSPARGDPLDQAVDRVQPDRSDPGSSSPPRPGHGTRSHPTATAAARRLGRSARRSGDPAPPPRGRSARRRPGSLVMHLGHVGARPRPRGRTAGGTTRVMAAARARSASAGSSVSPRSGSASRSEMSSGGGSSALPTLLPRGPQAAMPCPGEAGADLAGSDPSFTGGIDNDRLPVTQGQAAMARMTDVRRHLGQFGVGRAVRRMVRHDRECHEAEAAPHQAVAAVRGQGQGFSVQRRPGEHRAAL